MIILKSDYSPLAAELQEADNVKMIQALLILGGLSSNDLNAYNKQTNKSAADYEAALGEPNEHGYYKPEQWEAATEATKSPLSFAELVLKDALITIENKLIKTEIEGYFSHIESTVLSNGEPVARIERPIEDHEAESYEDNVFGYSYA